MPATRSPPIAEPPIPSNAADVVARCASVSASPRVIVQASRRCAGTCAMRPSMPPGSAAAIRVALSSAFAWVGVSPSVSMVNAADSRGGDQLLALVEEGVALLRALGLGVDADQRLSATEAHQQP